MEMTTTAILALFQTTKAQRESFVTDLLQRIESGEVNPLNVHLQLKSVEDIQNRLTDEKKYPEDAKRYRSALLDQAGTFGSKKFDYFGASIEQKEVGVKYDFSQCGDPVLASLLEKKEAIDKEVKARQDMLKTVSEKGLTMVDEATGETFTAYPPAKSSTTSLAVTLK